MAHRPEEHPPRLQRLTFIFDRSPLYFVTACTHGRRDLLANPQAHAAFQSFCQRASSQGVAVGSYVLMPDHFHLFVKFAPGALALSAWIKSLKNSLSKTFSAAGHLPPHWQKGFFDHIMRSAGSYSEKWHYVHANPVRAGLAKQPEDWPYRGSLQTLTFRRS